MREPELVEHWVRKFRNAFCGLRFGVAGQSSFYFHIAAALAVACLAALLRCELWHWCVLLLCIALVMSLELVNSAIEYLAAGLCKEQNPEVGKALDVAAAAVLLASVLSAIVGVIVFASRILLLLEASSSI
ncbi:MAG: diacylglycerol kinase [Planctomycetota bacterium]